MSKLAPQLHIVATIALLSAGALSSAKAQASELVISTQMAECALVKDTVRRLNCYDGVARQARKLLPEPPRTEPVPSAPTAAKPSAEPPTEDNPVPVKQGKTLRELKPQDLAELVKTMPRAKGGRYETEGALTLVFSSSDLIKR